MTRTIFGGRYRVNLDWGEWMVGFVPLQPSPGYPWLWVLYFGPLKVGRCK